MSDDDGWTTCEVCGVGINVTQMGGDRGKALLAAFVMRHLNKHAKTSRRSASSSSAALP